MLESDSLSIDWQAYWNEVKSDLKWPWHGPSTRWSPNLHQLIFFFHHNFPSIVLHKPCSHYSISLFFTLAARLSLSHSPSHLPHSTPRKTSASQHIIKSNAYKLVVSLLGSGCSWAQGKLPSWFDVQHFIVNSKLQTHTFYKQNYPKWDHQTIFIYLFICTIGFICNVSSKSNELSSREIQMFELWNVWLLWAHHRINSFAGKLISSSMTKWWTHKFHMLWKIQLCVSGRPATM